MEAAKVLRSLPLDGKNALTVGEGRAAAETNAGQIARAWDMWLRRAAQQHGLRVG